MSDKLLEDYYKSQFNRDQLTPILRMFAERKPWDIDREKDNPIAKQKRLDDELGVILKEVDGIYTTQLEKFHIPPEARSEDERKYGLLHPVVICEALLEKHNFTADENKNFKEILHKSFPEDQVTGYYSKRCMPSMVGFAHMFAKQRPEVPVCLIEGDFSNMGGCNVHFGDKSKTDKLLRVMSDSVKKTLSDPKNGALEVQCVRQGGDEVRLVVYGLKKERVQELLDTQVHPKLNLIAAQYGVHNIPHLKQGKLPGFGAAFACAQFDENITPNQIHDRFEKAIPHQKNLDGYLRMGMINMEGIDRYIEQLYVPTRYAEIEAQIRKKGARSPQLIQSEVSKILGVEVPEKKEELKPEMRRTRLYWESLISKEGANPDREGAYFRDYQKYKNSGEVAPDKITPEGFFDYIARTQTKNPDAIVIPQRPSIVQRIPFYHEDVIKRDEDPEMTRLRKALKRFGFDKMADVPYDIRMFNQKTRQFDRDTMQHYAREDKSRARIRHMVVDMMHFFDAHDPASLCKSDELMVEDAKDFVKEHGGMKVMVIELANLGGLNNVTYDLGNAALRHASEQIYMGLNSNPGPGGRGNHTSDHLYHAGGGNFWVLLPPQYRDEDFKGVESFVKRRIEGTAALVRQPVMKFAFDTYASPNMAKFELEPFEGMGKRKLRDKILDEREIRKTISEARLAELRKRLERLETGIPVDSIKMSDVPNLKEGGKSIGISQYDAQELIHPGDNIQQKLRQIDDAAKKHFEEDRQRLGPISHRG